MRHFIAITLAAVTLTGCATATYAPAIARNPFELPAGDDNRGLVIIALDEAIPATADGQNFDLNVVWFDPVKKVPYLESGAPSAANLSLVADAEGHRFLVGSIGQGEAVIPSYYSQNKWGLCYNAGTYHFFVKGGAYNFIGRFDDTPSFNVLDKAIAAGKLPASVPSAGPASTLLDQTLTGFTPGENRAVDKDRAAALAAAKLGHPVEVVTPVLTRTDLNLSKSGSGVPICYDHTVNPAERPDRSQPAPLTAPAADTAAKPSSDTVTWVSRPKVP